MYVGYINKPAWIIMRRMKQVIAILLKREKNIEQIRKIYVPNYRKFKPHITIVYPFEFRSQKELYRHIETSISKIKPFRLSLCGLKKSAKEYYLYLLVSLGKNELIKLYKNLNSGILKYFKNKYMPKYIPHLSLGVFKTNDEIKNAIREIKKENICFKTKIDSIQLLTFDKSHSLKRIENFKLQ